MGFLKNLIKEKRLKAHKKNPGVHPNKSLPSMQRAKSIPKLIGSNNLSGCETRELHWQVGTKW